MTNPYFSPSGNPGTGSTGLSAVMRAEFANISAAFDLLPALSGNGGKIVVVNPGGTALTVTSDLATQFSSPPPIGNVAPNTAAFTTLNLTGLATISSGITAASGTDQTLTTAGAGRYWRVANIGGGMGAVITATTNAGGNAQDGLTGNRVSILNILEAGFYRSLNNTFSLSGTTQFRPIDIQSNFVGTSAASLNTAYNFSVPSFAASVSTFSMIQHTLNVATGAKGSIFAATNLLTFDNGPIVGDTGTQQYVVENNWFQASVNAGGTDLGTNSRGSAYALNPQVVLRSGATFWALANALGEVDMAIEAGASVRQSVMGSFVLLSTHAVAGAETNYGLLIGSQVGAVGTIKEAFVVGGKYGPFPLASNSIMLTTDPQVARQASARNGVMPPQLMTGFIDSKWVNFTKQSGTSFKAPGATIDGTGQGTFGNIVTLGTTATGAKVDIGNAAVVTGVAVSVAGTAGGDGLNNYYPGDILYGTSVAPQVPGQYEVTHTKVIAAAVAAGGSGGTNGTQTVTGTTGTGTKFQASVTVAGGAITAVGSISVAGDYTVNPTNAASEPVTGASLTGARLSLGIGVLTATILVPDVFVSMPGTMVMIGGSGLGAVLSVTCTTENTLSLQPSGGILKTGSGTWTANASTATAMSSLGPAGAHTTVQEWLTVTNSSGVVRYVPAF